MFFPSLFSGVFLALETLFDCLKGLGTYIFGVCVVAGGIRCPRCGGDSLGRDGYRVRKDGIVQRYYCKKCGLRFPENYKQTKKARLPPDLAYLFVVKKETLDNIIERHVDFKVSRATINRRIMEDAKKYPSWREHVQNPKVRKKFGYVMGIDLTVVKIEGEKHQFLMVFDIPGRIPLVYTILPDKRVLTIAKVLEQLRSVGYVPRLVVSDMEECLIKAIRTVYGNVPIQWCLYHIQAYLDKYMPNKKKMSDEVRGLQDKVKTKIMEIAYAPNRRKQQMLVKELKELVESTTMPKRIRMAVNNFLKKLEYCHPRDEFFRLAGGCDKSYYYNNLCENAMRQLKEIIREKRGLKNVEAAQSYINVYWHHKIEEKLKDEDLQTEKEMFDPTLQLFLVLEKVNLAEISKAVEADLQLLKEKAEHLGLKVIGNYAFQEEYLKRKHKEIVMKKPKAVEEASKILNVDIETTQQVLSALGIKIKYRDIDVKKAQLIYPQIPLDLYIT